MLLSGSKYIFSTIESSILILSIYTLPFYTLDYISSISNNLFAYYLSTFIKNCMFVMPIIPILYLIIGQKIVKQLSTIKDKTTNGSHVYQNLLLSFSYLVISLLTNFNVYTNFLFSSISYSIYLSEITYNFISFDKYKYNNLIDFYNYNKKIFIISGLLFGIMSINIPIHFIPLLYFIFTILICPFLINYDYTPYNNLILHFNLFKIFELPINFIIFMTHTYMHNNITIKNIKKH